MTQRNALLLGVAGVIFTLLISNVEMPKILQRPILIQIQDKENVYYNFQDFAYSQKKEYFQESEQSYLFDSQNNKDDYFQHFKGNDNTKNPTLFEYRSLKNSRSFLFPLAKKITQTTKYTAEYDIAAPNSVESESNRLIWVEVGDDPASLEHAYPKGVVQFYTRLLDPLLNSDQRQPKGWNKLPRQFLPGNLYEAFEDYDSSLILENSPSENESVGSILVIVYESHSSELLIPSTWLRVYYLNNLFYEKIKDEFPFLYIDIKLPGMGSIETLSSSNGTVIFSRQGDHSLFWTGELPKPKCLNVDSPLSCSLEKTNSLENIVKGPSASRHFSSRSMFKSGGLSSIKFNRLGSLNSPGYFSILMASFKLSKNKYIAEIRSWSFDSQSFLEENKVTHGNLKDNNDTADFSFKKHISPDWITKKLLKMEIPIYYDVYGNMIESITQNTLLGSLTDHLTGHDHMPPPSFINLLGESLVIFPYQNMATLVKYCSITENSESLQPEFFYFTKTFSFESELQESVETRDAIYITQNRYARTNLDFVATRSYPIIQNILHDLNENKIFHRLSASNNNELVSLQFGDSFVLVFRNYLPSDQSSNVCSKEKATRFTSKPQYIIQSQDIDPLNIIGSLFYNHIGKDYLILVHSHGEVSSWILHEEEYDVSFSHIPLNRIVMMLFMIIVVSLFMSNELRIPYE